MPIVIDSSATIELILRRPLAPYVAEFFLEGESVDAPSLIDAEVLHTLRKMTQSREINEFTAQLGFERYRRLMIRRHPHSNLLEKVWSLRHNITAYDALYVALAQQLDATLLTADSKLAAAAGTHVTVDVLPIR